MDLLRAIFIPMVIDNIHPECRTCIGWEFFFNMDLKSVTLFERFLIFDGGGYKFCNQNTKISFWTKDKLTDGRCKSFLWSVCIARTAELDRNRCLLLTTKVSKESMYRDGKPPTGNDKRDWSDKIMNLCTPQKSNATPWLVKTASKVV